MNRLMLHSQGQRDCQGSCGRGLFGVVDSASSMEKQLCFSFIITGLVGAVTPGQ